MEHTTAHRVRSLHSNSSEHSSAVGLDPAMSNRRPTHCLSHPFDSWFGTCLCSWTLIEHQTATLVWYFLLHLLLQKKKIKISTRWNAVHFIPIHPFTVTTPDPADRETNVADAKSTF